ncbi:hypothetical protein LBBP_04114 [Leptospira borgpetersenii serovar Ballum]|uniref:Uncharacterized protein n=1 Tax=Leptospira borgpetersenii serovar Ballum TaxID=280505 RepID=A0A0S2IX55_LEPBO|nr:hypothetical protein LBBP_04114 [Leptospira borgpetersenii serovar Ballum]
MLISFQVLGQVLRNQSTGNKGDSWDLGGENRRSKVLASNLNRFKESWG